MLRRKKGVEEEKGWQKRSGSLYHFGNVAFTEVGGKKGGQFGACDREGKDTCLIEEITPKEGQSLSRAVEITPKKRGFGTDLADFKSEKRERGGWAAHLRDWGKIGGSLFRIVDWTGKSITQGVEKKKRLNPYAIIHRTD